MGSRNTAVAMAGLAAIALIVNAGLTVGNVRRMVETDASVRHTYQVLETAKELLSSLQDVESGQRGFLLTGDPSYLQAYQAGRGQVLQWLAHLGQITSDNPEQQSRVEAMHPLVEGNLAELERTIALRKMADGGVDTARALVLTGEGKGLMDALRVRVWELTDGAHRLLGVQRQAAAGAARTAVVTTLAGLAASLSLLGFAWIAGRRHLRERERNAERLLAEKELFRTTLTSIGDAVIVTDAAARVTVLNPTAASILGCGDDAVGRPLEEVFRIVNEVTRRSAENPARKVLREGRIVGLASHTVLLRRDGTEVPIDDSGAPILDHQGNLVGVVLVFRDIRARREAERELRRQTELLQEQDRRKDQFLAMLSHELRNPLAPIRNAVALLQRSDPASEPARRARVVMDRQVAHLTRLVDDLLDLSRIARGKIRVQRDPVDLGQVVRQAVEDHRDLFAQKAVVVQYHGSGGPLWVNGDATRLAQVSGNLLHNAAKFTNRGGRVTVVVGSEEGRAVLRVRDTGAGIDAETLANLFQPFVQADGTLHRTAGGLGLGLALSRGIVELHGGTIRGSSEGPGKGAEFVVSLPLAARVEPRRAPAAKPSAGGQRLSILIIEDNEDSAATLRDVLEMDGHQVLVALDGKSGIEMAMEARPDVVLCDIGLPGLDGYEVARRLRAADSPALLVAVTGYASPEDVKRAEDAGFHHHVAKPPDMERLTAIFRSLPGSFAPSPVP
jgi:two-component system CheB/CheR fusion protein